jgi:iron-sulfur cluster repair protein YtfE (RIC family)
MKITTSTELINYIKNNFHCLTNEEYLALINTTLKVYPLNKPCSVLQAVSMIKKMSQIPIEIRPLFPDINGFDD